MPLNQNTFYVPIFRDQESSTKTINKNELIIDDGDITTQECASSYGSTCTCGEDEAVWFGKADSNSKLDLSKVYMKRAGDSSGITCNWESFA